MRRWQQWTVAVAAMIIGIYLSGCGSIGSISKAPINKLAVGGTKKERQQQFLLRRLKWEHRGRSGVVTGLNFFTDSSRPISGAKAKDTLYIHKGAFRNSYTIKRVLRLVDRDRKGKRRRRVIIEIAGKFFDASQPQFWKVLHKGGQGISLSNNTFTDPKSFLPEVPVGTQLILITGGQRKAFTVIGNRADKFGLKGLQRIGYILREKLPKGLENLTYQVRIPKPRVSNKLSYHIHWRGSGLRGHNFTLGINRRRYGQKEVSDLLKSNKVSKKELRGLGGKRGVAIVMQVTGGVALVIGGFLALVRRDDFQGSLLAVPWSIAGGGLALLLGSIPLNVSANNDFLRAAQAYNKDLVRQLQITPKTSMRKTKDLQQNRNRLASPGPVPAKTSNVRR